MSIPNHEVISITPEQRQRLNVLLKEALSIKSQEDDLKEEYKSIIEQVTYLQLDKTAFNKLVVEQRKSEDKVTKARHVELILDMYRDIVLESGI